MAANTLDDERTELWSSILDEMAAATADGRSSARKALRMRSTACDIDGKSTITSSAKQLAC